MSFLIRLGFKNIGRNKLRSALTLVAVALCSGGILMFSVLFSGITNMFLEGLTTQNGHVRIIDAELAKNERLKAGYHFVQNVDHVLKTLKGVKGVQYVLPRIETGGYMEHSFTRAEEKKAIAAKRCVHKTLAEPTDPKSKKISKQTPGGGVGMNPDAEKSVTDLHKRVVRGRMMKATGKEIVLGRLLAERLHACTGSKITMIGKTVDDSMSAVTLTVVGIVNMGGSMLDKRFYINLKTAQHFLDLPNQVGSILVYGKDLWESTTLRRRINQVDLKSKVHVAEWQKSPLAAMALPMLKVFIFILGGIIMFVGGVGLFNTMMMSVLERQDEVGIMMALGLHPGQVRNAFLLEGFVYGVVGAVSGVLLAMVASIPLLTTGISFGTDATSKIPFPMETTIKGSLSLDGILIGLAVGVLMTIIGSIIPAVRASHLEPVEILRK